MQKNRPYVMCLSGHDPSGGAGLLADIKTFEMHRMQGLGVCTAITYQNEDDFVGIEWLSETIIIRQIEVLLDQYKPVALKVGIIENLILLEALIDLVKRKCHEIKIVWDPVLKASAGFDFQKDLDRKQFLSILKKIDLLTPNIPECELLFGMTKPDEIAKQTSTKILLKGGHSDGNIAMDQLIVGAQVLQFKHFKKSVFSKHGTGCILSSAIAANLALGESVPEACKNAKEYIQSILTSNSTRLAYHFDHE